MVPLTPNELLERTALKFTIFAYGKGRWRERKGIATVRLSNGTILEAEIHWYEATGIGKKEYKIKYLLD